MTNWWKNMMIFGTKSPKLLKMDLIMSLHTMEKDQKLKQKFMKEKPIQIFVNDKMPKWGSHCICLSVILIYPVFKKGKNCYPQVFLEEYKWIVNK